LLLLAPAANCLLAECQFPNSVKIVNIHRDGPGYDTELRSRHKLDLEIDTYRDTDTNKFVLISSSKLTVNIKYLPEIGMLLKWLINMLLEFLKDVDLAQSNVKS
jgi:hypothetical protein